MTFLVRAPRSLGVTSRGIIVGAEDPDALGIVPEGKLIPIDDAERLGLTTEADERARADAPPGKDDICPKCGSDLRGRA